MKTLKLNDSTRLVSDGSTLRIQHESMDILVHPLPSHYRDWDSLPDRMIERMPPKDAIAYADYLRCREQVERALQEHPEAGHCAHLHFASDPNGDYFTDIGHLVVLWATSPYT